MTIVFATNNSHKLQEIREILPEGIEVKSLSDIGCNEDIPETGATLEENALQKARYIASRYHVSVFADDTGLEVEALDGAPGIYSARYASLDSDALPHDSEANTAKLLRNLSGEANRRARFRTVVALIFQHPLCPCGCTFTSTEHLFEGTVEGTITQTPSGNGGFGYDPVFRPDGYDATFAELGSEIKNRISHRARATALLARFLQNQQQK